MHEYMKNMEEMTDRQMEFIVNMVVDKFSRCKDMDEVKEAIDDVKQMIRKDKAEDKDKNSDFIV